MPKKPKNRKRAVRGTGTVFWSARRKCYVARKPVGRRGSRTLYLERTGETQKEAIANRDKALPPGPKTTVGEWAERWLSELSHRPLTRDGYERSVRLRIGPTLGPQPVRALTPYSVEGAARRWGESVGANTVLLTLAHLRACLSAAVRAGLIATNPVASAKKPKAVKPQIDPFSPGEAAAIIRACRAGEEVVALLAATGLRRGEAVALEVGDYDPATGAVSVTKTYSRKHGLRRPKSENGIRTIRVPAAAVPAFLRAIGKRRSGPLFPAAHGTGRRQHNTVRANWAVFLRRLGLAYRRPHQTRHTVATLLISAGAPIGDVAKYLGDSPQTVVRTYLHATGADVCAVLDGLYGGSKYGSPAGERAKRPRK